MRLFKKSFILITIALLVSGIQLTAQAKKTDTTEVKHAKYIFLLIGDGMGPGQRESAENYIKSKQGADIKLRMNNLPVTGSATTHSTSKVTDSAAAGTALACGVKTNNGMLGLTPMFAKLKAISFDAKERGMKVGIISSVPINHATPAAFYANIISRSVYNEIGKMLPNSGFNYFAGEPFLINKNAKDKRSLYTIAEEKGYTFARNAKQLEALKKGDDKVIVSIKIPYEIDQAPGCMTLDKFVAKGIELLDNDKGFFMMVEGGKIDWACHGNNAPQAVRETVDFDKTVKLVYDFYLKHKDETLIVITADHETGGMGVKSVPENFHKLLDGLRSSKGIHTLTARWKKENVSFDKALKELEEKLGLTKLSDAEKESIKKAYDIFMSEDSKDKRAPEIQKMYGSKNPVQVTCFKIMSKRLGISWTTRGHSATPVPTTAIGVGAELFKGDYDNTDIAKRLRAVILSKK